MEFAVSTEIKQGVREAVSIGFTSAILVVSAVSAVVSGFKALLRMIGR